MHPRVKRDLEEDILVALNRQADDYDAPITRIANANNIQPLITWTHYKMVIWVKRPLGLAGEAATEYKKDIFGAIALKINKEETRVPLKMTVTGLKCHTGNDCGLICIEPDANKERCKELRKLIFPNPSEHDMSRKLGVKDLNKLIKPLNLQICYYSKTRGDNFMTTIPEMKYSENEARPTTPPKVVKMYLDGEHWTVVKEEPNRCEEGASVPIQERPAEFIAERTTFEGVCEQMRECVLKLKCLLITGQAGTGKSHLIMSVVKDLIAKGDCSAEEWAFCAFTGVAAKRINTDEVPSRTLSSKFKLQRLQNDDKGATEAMINRSFKSIISNRGEEDGWYLKLRYLFIDEIFALSRGNADYLDKVLQKVRGNKRPFGGVLLYAAGDPGQLPPVNAHPFQFSNVFKNISTREGNSFLSYARLTEIKRATDPSFQSFCENLRVGELTPENKAWIHKKSYKSVESVCASKRSWNKSDVTVLTYKNNSKHNHTMSEELLASTPTHHNVVTMNQNDKIQTIKMCKGFRVMLTKNINGVGVNGSIGSIIGWNKYSDPCVKFDDDPKEYVIEQYHVKSGKKRSAQTVIDVEDEEDEQGNNKAYNEWYTPLILAWSITFHKCQGLTLKGKIIIDAASIQFVDDNAGLLYVAVTRATDPKNIVFLHGNNKYLLPCTWDKKLPQEFDNWLQKRHIGDPVPVYVAKSNLYRESTYKQKYDTMKMYRNSDVFAQDNGETLNFLQHDGISTVENDVYFDLETHPGTEKEGHRFKTWMCTMLHHHTNDHDKKPNEERLDPKILSARKCTKCNHSMKFQLDTSPCNHSSMDKVGTKDPLVQATDSITYKCWTTLDKDTTNPLHQFVSYLIHFFEKNRKRVCRKHQFVHGSGGIVSAECMNVYSFNGAAFDTLLLFNYMIETWEPKGYELHILPRGTTLISMMVTKVLPDLSTAGSGSYKKMKRVKVMEFKDMRLLVGGGSLRGAVKSFVGRKSAKSYWPHEWLNAENMEKMINLPPKEYVNSIKAEHFGSGFQDDVAAKKPEAIRIKKALDNGTYNAAQEARTYGCIDTLELAHLGYAVKKMFHKNSNSDMAHFLTASAYSKYTWLCKLPPKLVKGQMMNRQQKIRKYTQLHYPRTEIYEKIHQTVFGGKTAPRTFVWRSVDYEMLASVPGFTPEQLYRMVRDYLVYLDINGMYAKEEVGPTNPIAIQPTVALTKKAREEEKKVLERKERNKNPLCNKYPCGKMMRVTEEYNSDLLNLMRKEMNNKGLWKRCMNRQSSHRVAPKHTTGAEYKMGFVCCDFVDQTSNLESIVCRKSKDGRNVWDTGEYHNKWISMVDYYTLLLAGATVSAIHEAIVFEEAEPVFRKFALACLKGKAECAARGDAVGKAFKKLETNGVYGKSLEDSHKTMTAIITDLPRPKVCVNNANIPEEDVLYSEQELQNAEDTSLDLIEEQGWKFDGILNFHEWASGKHKSMVVTCNKIKEEERSERNSYKVWKILEKKEDVDGNEATDLLTFTYEDINTDRDPAKITYEKTLLYLGSTLLAFTREHIFKILKAGNRYAYEKTDISYIDKTGRRRLRKNTIHDRRDLCIERLHGQASELMSMEEWNHLLGVVYGDTDSFMVTAHTMWKLMKAGYLGGEPGQLGDEVKHEKVNPDDPDDERRKKWNDEGMGKIVWFVSIGPKTYAVRYILPSGKVMTKYALKGIPSGAITKEFVENIMEIMTAIVNKQQGGESVNVAEACFNWQQFTRIGINRMTNPQRQRGLAPATIHKTQAHRSLGKSTFKGRDVLPVPPEIQHFWRPSVPLSYSGNRDIFKDMTLKEFIQKRYTINQSVPDMDVMLQVWRGEKDLNTVREEHLPAATPQPSLVMQAYVADEAAAVEDVVTYWTQVLGAGSVLGKRNRD